MKSCGIIVEYNPLHNGHLYHIKKSKEITHCDCLIAVMSGNFVQRGEMAICDKWTRAKEAIKQGVDLVIELPYIYATSSADYFAYGAVEILKLLQVDDIVFGSESNDLNLLQNIDSNHEYDSKNSYASNFAKQYKLKSNDILAHCYIKALKDSNIKYHSIQRTNEYLNEEIDHEIASASAIRKAIIHHQDYQHTTPMQDLNDLFCWDNYYDLLQYVLLTTANEELEKRYLVHEGLHNLFKKQASIHHNYQDFIKACISKKYPKSKLQRTLLQILIQVTKEEVSKLPKLDYIRVLAFNDQGKSYLKQIKDQVNIATKFNQIPIKYRELELKATQVYFYPLNNKQRLEAIKKEWQSACYIS